MLAEIVSLLFGLIVCFWFGQLGSIGYIGNRSYSCWYETHFLIRRVGLCKLIYYKPKHFGRYTLFEVVCFFSSYVFLIIFGGIAILLSLKIITSLILYIIVVSLSMLLFIGFLVTVIINDIGAHNDKKIRFNFDDRQCSIDNIKLDYRSKIESVKSDFDKVENINKEFIEYLKNLDDLIIIKGNDDGTFVYKLSNK